MNLFSKEKQEFHLPDAHLIYIPNSFSITEANLYFNNLYREVDWQEDDITIFGKTYKQPRLTALYGENSKPYSYSSITMYPKPFTSDIIAIKERVENLSKDYFNTVLLNLYRYGSDSNGWHADDEKVLGENPVIASLSLGAERTFHLKHKKIKTLKHKLILHNGSLLLMKGTTQHNWFHQIPKTKKMIEKRINLTFRLIK